MTTSLPASALLLPSTLNCVTPQHATTHLYSTTPHLSACERAARSAAVTMDSDLATFSDIPANYVLAAASCVVAAAVAAFVLLGGKKEAKPYARFPSPRWVTLLAGR